MDSNQENWDKKTIELKGSILQSWAWGEFLRGLGKKIHRVSGEGYQALLVETELPMGRKYLYCPRGPLGNFDKTLAEVLNLAGSDRSTVFVRMEPADIPKGLQKSDKDIQPTRNWVLDIAEKEEAILARMKPKHRYNINLAERKGVTVREGDEKDLVGAYRLLLETSNRNGFRLHPQQYYWQLFKHLYPGNLKLMLAEYKGEIVAADFLTIFGISAVYLHGGSSQRYKEVMAPYLLHWRAIQASLKQGLEEYDFGGIAPAGDEKHAWAGITRFKKGFGGREVVFPGSFDFVLSPVWYNVYKQARKFRSLLKQK